MKKMKILLAIAIIAALSFTACSKDNTPSGAVTNGSITEKWNPEKVVVTGIGINSTQVYSGNEADCDKDYLEFLATNVLNFVVINKNSSNVCTPAAPETSTYTKSVNSLTISNGTYGGTYTITTLSDSELILKSVASQGGVQITTNTYFTKAVIKI